MSKTARAYPAPRLLTLPMIHGRCEEVGECLIWTQAASTRKGAQGQPYAQHGGKVVGLRRLVYELATGEPPPEGKVLRMRCEQSLCLHQDHMRVTTRLQQVRETVKSGALSTPSANAARTAAARRRAAERGMTMERARAVRAEVGTLREIAERMGMPITTVGAIRRGDAWRETVAAASVFAQGVSG